MRNSASITVAVFLMLATLALSARAQYEYEGEPEYSNIPEDPIAWLHATLDAESDFDDKDTETDASVTAYEVDTQASAPLIWNDPVMLLAGLHLNWTRFSFSGLELEDQDVYTVAAPIDLIYEGLYPWEFLVELAPGYHTDFKEIDGDDFRLLGFGLAVYPVTPVLSLAAGVAYDQIFGEDKFFPLGGVIWEPTPEWQVSLLYPMPKVTFAPNPGIAFYVNAEPAGGNWSVYDDDQEYNFKLESMRASAGVDFEMAPGVWLMVQGGLNMDRTYEIHAGDSYLLDADADDALYARVGLVLR